MASVCSLVKGVFLSCVSRKPLSGAFKMSFYFEARCRTCTNSCFKVVDGRVQRQPDPCCRSGCVGDQYITGYLGSNTAGSGIHFLL